MVEDATLLPERRLSNEVTGYFSECLEHSFFRGSVAVDANMRVLANLTIGKSEERGWQYYLGMLEQDVVFYLKAQALPILPDPARYERLSGEQQAARAINIPLVICELKAGSPNTHAFITYSNIAQQIRVVHPHCAYYFVIGKKNREIKPPTILRQAKGFDRVFLNWEIDKERSGKTSLITSGTFATGLA